MPKKKKEKEVEIPPEEQQEEQIMILQDDGSSEIQLRLQLLGLSKEILEHRSHLGWETHKKAIDVTVEDVIDGAKELLDFVMEENLQN